MSSSNAHPQWYEYAATIDGQRHELHIPHTTACVHNLDEPEAAGPKLFISHGALATHVAREIAQHMGGVPVQAVQYVRAVWQ